VTLGEMRKLISGRIADARGKYTYRAALFVFCVF
jgi:hypothetical protein